MAGSSAYILKFCLVGAVLVTGTAPEASPRDRSMDHTGRKNCSVNIGYKIAKDILPLAKSTIVALNYPKANLLLDEALQKLGASYYSNSEIDDTGISLTFAKVEESRGNLSIAANLKNNTLESRLAMYRRTHDCL